MRNKVAICLIMVFLCLGYVACIDDKCQDTVCFNGGVCVQNVCSCPYLYEGDDCSVAWHKKFSGTWKSDEVFSKDTSNTHRDYTIQVLGASDSFLLSGLGDTLNPVICKRTSRFGFTFLKGHRPDSFTVINSGKGTITEDETSVTGLYSFSTADTTVTTFFTWTR